MKYLSMILVLVLVFACSQAHKNPGGILKLADYPEAEAYVNEQIALCGEGVVEGSASGARNDCGFKFKVDDEFIKNHNRPGLLHDENWPYQEGEMWFTAADTVEVPEEFDLRSLLKEPFPSPRQQKCGDCWFWSTHHAMEMVRALAGEGTLDLSVQTGLSCSRHGSCNGGYMTAVGWLVGRGLPMENSFPYVGRDVSCKFSKEELEAGWEGKPFGAPSIGSSLNYSRFFKGDFREGNKVKNITSAMAQQKGPVVVTVAAYSSSGGVVDSFSAINSGGNHMVTLTGWRTINGKKVAHVYNSWGTGHGDGAPIGDIKTPGVSSIVWEKSDGQLNRGLGVSARILQYKSPCQPPEAYIGKAEYQLLVGNSVKLGKPQEGVTCKWSPLDGLSDPNSCETIATPDTTTEYHLEVTNTCGTSSAQALVEVLGPVMKTGPRKILTPHGIVTLE